MHGMKTVMIADSKANPGDLVFQYGRLVRLTRISGSYFDAESRGRRRKISYEDLDGHNPATREMVAQVFFIAPDYIDVKEFLNHGTTEAEALPA
nr:hypothetical protein K70PH128C1_LOCUS52 [Klebsiella phage vB_Ko_K70PH128C1]